MARTVRNGRGVAGRTRVSPKHQVTIPAGAFDQAGLQVGDVLEVEAATPGRLVLRTVDSLIDRHAGCLDTGGALRRELEQLRDEWR